LKVIQNALPKELAEDARSAVWNAKYKSETQYKDGYYQDRPGEPYMCSFKRASEIDSKVVIKIGEVLRKHLGVSQPIITNFYKMIGGDFFRIHDDLKNGLGFVLYLSDTWQWDWGGLLMVKDGDGYTAYKPEFNQLVVIEPKGTPHFVTQIAEYAHLPRYAVVGFA